MRLYILMMLLCAAMFAACQPGAVQPTRSPEPPTLEAIEPLTLAFDGQVDFALDGLSIRLPKPEGWESLSTEYGVIIAERFARLADRGVQQGLIVYVFVTPLSQFPPDDQRSAQDILTSLMEVRPDGERLSSNAERFTWGGYDAAYYLVSEAAAGPQTLIVGVRLPDEGILLTGAVKAPRAQAGQIREVAPLLLGGVAVNGVPLGAEGLDMLPDPLVFPE